MCTNFYFEVCTQFLYFSIYNCKLFGYNNIVRCK
nr:MAG TPA: hypothetical protein [Caudoviricetes sp.]